MVSTTLTQSPHFKPPSCSLEPRRPSKEEEACTCVNGLISPLVTRFMTYRGLTPFEGTMNYDSEGSQLIDDFQLCSSIMCTTKVIRTTQSDGKPRSRKSETCSDIDRPGMGVGRAKLPLR